LRNAYKILVGTPEGKRPLGWKDGKVWTGFIWLKIGNSGGLLGNTVMYLRIS
jgi:hypothetical protein